jgi:diaminopimelate epimerase
MKPSTFSFTKIEAAGNDFVFIDGEGDAFARRHFDGRPVTEVIPQICGLHTGIGADGIVFMWAAAPDGRSVAGQKWRWAFYNGDGSSASMCGNATRAATLWLRARFPGETSFVFDTDKGPVTGRFESSGFPRTQWKIEEQRFPLAPAITDLLRELPAELEARATHVDTGVPHLVVVTRELPALAVRLGLAPRLRRHASLGAAGANVTFVGRDNLAAVTFERGVEGETLACGSGALAAYLGIESESPTRSAKGLTFGFPGGGLAVDRQGGALGLSGPARIVFEGDYRL